MGTLYNKETRKPEALDGDAYVQAVASGTHSFKNGDRVNFFDDSGTPQNIDASKVQEAIAAGWRPATPSDQAVYEYVQENKGLKGDLKVGLGQFVDEALIGLPELVLDKTQDPLEVAKREGLKKEHGAANTISGVAGGLASMFVGAPLFKGAGLAGQAVERLAAEKLAVAAGREVAGEGVKAAATQVLKKAAAKAAGGAAEGAVMSLPHAITEASLGDPNDAAETLMWGLGVGSLFGGGGSLAGDAYKKVSDKVSKSALNREVLDGAEGMNSFFGKKANEKAVEALNPTLSQLERIENSKDVNKLGQMLRDEGIVTPLASKDEMFERLAKKTSELGAEKGAMVKQFDDAIFAQGNADLLINPTDLTRTIKEDVAAKLGGLDAYAPYIKSFNKQLDDIANTNRVWSLQEAEAQKSAWGDVIKTWGLDKTVEKKITENIYRGINKEVEAKVEQGFGKEALKEFKDLKQKYGYLEEAEKIAQKSSAREAKNNDIGLTSFLSGAAGATVYGLPGLAIGLAGREITRKYGDQIASALYGKMEGLLFVEQAMKKVGQKIDTIPDVLKKMSSGTKENPKAYGTGALLRIFDRDHDTSKPISINERFKKLEEFNEKASTLVANPQHLTEQIANLSKPISSGGAPNIGAAFSGKMVDGLQYINSVMPKPPKPKSVFAPDVKWRPSDYELSKFEQKLQVVQDPFSVFQELQQGTLTRNHMEALQAVYPWLAQKITNKIVLSAAENPQTIPYSQRMKLSLVLGVPLDDSTTPRSVAYYQQTFLLPDQGAEQLQPAAPMQGGFKADVNVARGAATDMQALSAREMNIGV